MARPPRSIVAGIPMHVIQRGNNRQSCFLSDQDCHVYLARLVQCCRKYKVAIHAFVLMTNHVHLLVTPSDVSGVGLMMQALGRCYVRYFNAVHQRTGTLWEGRYKASLVACDSYFLTVSRYIELNPVRAGIVEHPADFRWSSYRENVLGLPTKLLTPHALYQGLAESAEGRQRAYGALFANVLPADTLDRIRNSINRSLVLGNREFAEPMVSARMGSE